MNRSISRFIFEVIYFSSTLGSSVYTFIKKFIMFDSGGVFDLYNGDYFDKVSYSLKFLNFYLKIFRSH